MTCHPDNGFGSIHWLMADIMNPELEMVSMTSIDYNTWHNRFGHPGNDALRHAPDNVQGLEKKIPIPTEKIPCKGCEMGKAAQQPYPPSKKRAEHILDLVHMDIKEIPNLSYHKFKYVLTILDDCSSFAVAVKIRHKHEAFQAFKDYKSWAENQSDRKIKCIHIV